MTKLITIRSILAGFFLLLFAFCITPKRTLHNLIANHKDGRAGVRVNDPNQSQIGRSGFNCQLDNLISESPFVEDSQIPFTLPEPVFSDYQEKYAGSFYTAEFFCSGLRGPPAC